MPGCFAFFKKHSASNSVSCPASEKEPPAYSSHSPAMPEKIGESSVVEETIDRLDGQLRELSLSIWNHPETALKEFRTHDELVKFMKAHNFEVTPHAYGLETAWKAEFAHVSTRKDAKGKGRVIGFMSEMDALPTIGHGCGHNLIAIVGVGAAIATAKALKENDVSGRVVLLGTPAEEDQGGKIMMINEGAFKDLDVCLMAHGVPKGWSGFAPFLAIQDVTVEYTGRGAHSAQAPWQGINALDAAVMAYSNVSVLRQQVRPDERVHGVIRDRQGWATNIIPATSALEYGIRAPSLAALDALKKRVYDCFKGAAEATGCKYDIKEAFAYYEIRNCGPMADSYTHYMEDRAQRSQSTSLGYIGSTDAGNVSYEVPTIHPTFDIACPPGLALHTTEFRDQAGTPEAHKEALIVAKALASTAYQVATDSAYYQSIVEWFEQDKKDRKA